LEVISSDVKSSNFLLATSFMGASSVEIGDITTASKSVDCKKRILMMSHGIIFLVLIW
jgi:hypothetical protein